MTPDEARVRDVVGRGVPRVADLREPPVVGRFYAVPVVWANDWCGLTGNLPVVGPAHTDKDHFNFPHRHYHVDVRFLNARELRATRRHYGDEHATVGGLPLSNVYGGGVPLGRPALARRRCSSSVAVYRHGDKKPVQALRAQLGEPDAIRLADGRLLCPHRKVDLSSFAPDEHGMVTCPLHGLRVRCLAVRAEVIRQQGDSHG